MRPQTRRKAGARSFWQIFGAPAALCLLSCIGLLAALIGDGVFDITSWLMLSLPVCLILWHLNRRQM